MSNIDFTTVPIHIKEVLFIKVKNLTKEDKVGIFRVSEAFHLNI